MEPLVISILSSMFIGAVVYFVLIRKKDKEKLSSRLDDVVQSTGGNPFGDQREEAAEVESIEKKTLSLEESYRSRFGRMLYIAGMRTKQHIRFFRMIQFTAILIPGLLIGLDFLSGNLTQKGIFNSLVFGVLVFMGAVIFLRIKIQRRKSTIFKSMPTFFDLLVILLETGVNFTGALPRIIKELPKSDPLAQEFNLLHNEYLAGVPFKDACRRLTERCEIEDLTVILDALVEAEKLGASLAGTIRIEAQQLRHKIRSRMKERAQKIPVKLMMPMMMIFSTMFVLVFGPLGTKLFGTLAEAFPKADTSKPNIMSSQEPSQDPS